MKNSKTVFYLLTDTEVYRTDEILRQIDQWIVAFKTGRLLRVPYASPEALAEFEAHLEAVFSETQNLVENDLNF